MKTTISISLSIASRGQVGSYTHSGTIEETFSCDFIKLEIIDFIKLEIVDFIKLEIVDFIKLEIVDFIKLEIVDFIKLEIVDFIKLEIVDFIKLEIVDFIKLEISGEDSDTDLARSIRIQSECQNQNPGIVFNMFIINTNQ